MNTKYFIYALLVTAVSTGTSWTKMITAATQSDTNSGSSWSSRTGGGGGSYGGGAGGGGHK